MTQDNLQKYPLFYKSNDTIDRIHAFLKDRLIKRSGFFLQYGKRQWRILLNANNNGNHIK